MLKWKATLNNVKRKTGHEYSEIVVSFEIELILEGFWVKGEWVVVLVIENMFFGV